jgi:hypothetical protein
VEHWSVAPLAWASLEFPWVQSLAVKELDEWASSMETTETVAAVHRLDQSNNQWNPSDW